MADVFNSRTGYVAVVPGQAVIPGRVKISGFEPTAALIENINYRQRTNQQFQYALDGSVYIYVFGDEMGNVQIQGMILPILCTGESTGMKEVLAFYAANRASKSQALVEVSVGEEVVSGFLTGLGITGVGVASDALAMIQRYSMVINTLPKAS
jgi:hypothetical protein